MYHIAYIAARHKVTRNKRRNNILLMSHNFPELKSREVDNGRFSPCLR